MFDVLKKYFLRYQNPDCLSCFLRLQLIAADITMPISTTCRHFGCTNGEKFTSPNTLRFTTYLTIIWGLAFFIYDSQYVLDAVIDERQAIVLIEMVLSFNLSISGLANCWKLCHKVKELNGLVAILQTKEKFRLKCFFEGNVTRNAAVVSFLCTIWLLVQQLFFIIYSSCVNENLTFGSVMRVITLELTYSYGAVATLHVYFLIFVYRSMFSQCYQLIKRDLLGRDEKWSAVLQHHSYYYNSLNYKLKLLCRLYGSLIRNFKEGVLYYSVPYTISWPLCIITYIASFYVFLVERMQGSEGTITTSFLKVKIVLMVLGVTAIFFVVQSLSDLSNDVLSFLFRYPISKLSASEAAQVEVLITALTTQKPILTASNIFTIGTRLLASISGTVVTYLLVALQFHVSWTKKTLHTS